MVVVRGGVEVLSHTHVAPAGRIKMHALHRAIISPTKSLKVIFLSHSCSNF